MPNYLLKHLPHPPNESGGIPPAPQTEGCLAGCPSLHQFADALGNAVDARDPQLYNHSHDVAEAGRILANALGLSSGEADLVHIAGHLHDIGKIGIPDAVLKKQGALTPDEWTWMKRHPEIGAEILRPVPSFSMPGGVADIVLAHHERYDGGGYPRGLRGAEIPLGARIVAVADTLSALLRDRPYRRGCSFGEALAEIRRSSGSQLDPTAVRALLESGERIRKALCGAGLKLDHRLNPESAQSQSAMNAAV